MSTGLWMSSKEKLRSSRTAWPVYGLSLLILGAGLDRDNVGRRPPRWKHIEVIAWENQPLRPQKDWPHRLLHIFGMFTSGFFGVYGQRYPMLLSSSQIIFLQRAAHHRKHTECFGAITQKNLGSSVSEM